MQIRMVRDHFGLLYVQPKALGVFVSFVFWEEEKKKVYFECEKQNGRDWSMQKV